MDIDLGDAAVVMLSPVCGNTGSASALFSTSLERYLPRHYLSLNKHWVNSFFPLSVSGSATPVFTWISAPDKFDLGSNNDLH